MSMSSKTRVYALGSNGSFQLGLTHNNDISTPECCLFNVVSHKESKDYSQQVDYLPPAPDEQVIKTASGGNHTLILTSFGAVWFAGSAISCLGRDERQTSQGWHKLDWTIGSGPHTQIIDIAANWETSYFATVNDIYSCGSNGKGELGRGQNANGMIEKCFSISEYEAGAIRSVRACMNHVVIVSSTGQLYGWGASRKGQLGIEAKQQTNTVWMPQHIPVDFPVEQVTVGRDFTLVLGSNGELAVLGDVSRLGFTHNDVGRYTLNQSRELIDLHSGWTHVFVQTQSQICGFGKNPRGQILSTATPCDIKKLDVGSEHSVALLQDGTVIAWGWGEHGNCGSDIDNKGNVSSKHNLLFTPSSGQTVVGISAGCATTFLWTYET